MAVINTRQEASRELGAPSLESLVKEWQRPVQDLAEALQARAREEGDGRWQTTAAQLRALSKQLDELVREVAAPDKVEEFREALSDESLRKHDPQSWAALQNNLGNALFSRWQRDRDLSDLRRAVEAYEGALPEREAKERAETQCNLGNALVELGEREAGTVALARAAESYRKALTQYTPAEAPSLRSKVLSLLGAALRKLGEDEKGTASFEAAVTACREARSLVGEGTLWRAFAEMNLANALWGLGEKESREERYQEAISLFEQVLETCPRERHRALWASAQRGLGNVLQLLGKLKHDPEALRQAVNAYRDALKEETEAAAPLERVRILNGLGTTLGTLAEQEIGTGGLEEARAVLVEAVDASQKVASAPLERASLNNLGNVLRALGEREPGTKRLGESVAAYERALAKGGASSSTVLTNLGHAMHLLGEREVGTERLERAVETLRRATELRETDAKPLAFATSKNYLGLALRALGEREEGTARLEEAERALAEAARLRQGKVPHEWARTECNRGVVLELLAERRSDPGHLEEAIAAYQRALEVQSPSHSPWDWVRTRTRLSAALESLAEKAPRSERFERAVAESEESLQSEVLREFPILWSTVKLAQGDALWSWAEHHPTNGVALRGQAVTAYREALDVSARESVAWALRLGRSAKRLDAMGIVHSHKSMVQRMMGAGADDQEPQSPLREKHRAAATSSRSERFWQTRNELIPKLTQEKLEHFVEVLADAQENGPPVPKETFVEEVNHALDVHRLRFRIEHKIGRLYLTPGEVIVFSFAQSKGTASFGGTKKFELVLVPNDFSSKGLSKGVSVESLPAVASVELTSDVNIIFTL